MHVIRCFEDTDVTHVNGRLDPAGDAETVMTELILKDMETVESRRIKDQKLAGSGDREAAFRVSFFEKLTETLNRGLPASSMEKNEMESEIMSDLNLLTMKPVFYCANVSEDEINRPSPLVRNLRESVAGEGSEILVISGKIEAEIAELEEDEKEEFLEEMGLKESGLTQVIRKGYEILGLQTFFTVKGNKEVRANTVPKGIKAARAAGTIHSDFERGFIRAEVLSFNDFKTCGSWNGARQKGLVRSEGRDYQVQDGDIIQFLFNV